MLDKVVRRKGRRPATGTVALTACMLYCRETEGFCLVALVESEESKDEQGVCKTVDLFR